MLQNHLKLVAIAFALGMAASPVQAQFFGGGFWGEGFGVGTAEGDMARSAGMYAMGMGQFNLDTAKAVSIDSDTMMRWNQYIYHSRIESGRNNRARLARQDQTRKATAETIRLRMRNTPDHIDITTGNALNLAVEELNDPKVFEKAIYAGSKVKLGGRTIRDIPFQYAAAAISISVQELVQGPPPAGLRGESFAEEMVKLKAVVAELRSESEELGADKPETIKKAKDLILAIRTKAEANFPRNSQNFREAGRYLKALYGLASMLETPATEILLAGVDNRPDATLGELMKFMSLYNLRFGVATTPSQREIYLSLFPTLSRIRDEVLPGPPIETPAMTPMIEDAPSTVFDGVGYNHREIKGPTPPPIK